MKKEQGITLVSLVVTIIVLIILAGVSINLLLGQNGIITIAKQAKENMQLAQVEEQEELNELYSQIAEEGSGSTSYDSIAKLVEFKREIASAITDVGINTSEDASAETMASNIRSIPFKSDSKTDFEFTPKNGGALGTQTINNLSKGDLILVTGGISSNKYINLQPTNITGGLLISYKDNGVGYTRAMFVIKAESSTVSFTGNSNMTSYISICVLKSK